MLHLLEGYYYNKNKCNIVLVYFFKGNCCFNWSKKDTITKKQMWHSFSAFFKGNCCFIWSKKDICFSVIVSFFDQIKQQFPLKNALKLCYICFLVIVSFFDQLKQQFPLKKYTKTMLRRILLQKNICNIVLVQLFKGNCCLIYLVKEGYYYRKTNVT
jgi:hypothetical protein